jgi:hypothetical protein
MEVCWSQFRIVPKPDELVLVPSFDLIPHPKRAKNPPSLLASFAFSQAFFQNGSAASLDDVVKDVQHLSAGTSTLTNPADRAAIAAFITSIAENSSGFLGGFLKVDLNSAS